jgi:hypothetical protein
MTPRKLGTGTDSPYCAFKDDRERKWALISRDVRWVLVAVVFALGGIPAVKWQAIWLLIGGK